MVVELKNVDSHYGRLNKEQYIHYTAEQFAWRFFDARMEVSAHAGSGVSGILCR